MIQALIGIWLIVALALHLASRIIGLSVIILATAFCRITEEHALEKAFEALPFTALLTVFFLSLPLLLTNSYSSHYSVCSSA